MSFLTNFKPFLVFKKNKRIAYYFTFAISTCSTDYIYKSFFFQGVPKFSKTKFLCTQQIPIQAISIQSDPYVQSGIFFMKQRLVPRQNYIIFFNCI